MYKTIVFTILGAAILLVALGSSFLALRETGLLFTGAVLQTQQQPGVNQQHD